MKKEEAIMITEKNIKRTEINLAHGINRGAPKDNIENIKRKLEYFDFVHRVLLGGSNE